MMGKAVQKKVWVDETILLQNLRKSKSYLEWA